MFLELSFDSRVGDKDVSASKAARSWTDDHEDKHEMSLDELISDFQRSASSLRPKLDQSSASGSDASPLPLASPPKHSKAKQSGGKASWGLASRPRAVKPEPAKRKWVRSTAKNVERDDSSDDEATVSPMPRLERVLRNRPSLLANKRHTTTPASRSKPAPTLRRRREVKSPVPSSPSLTPPSLSPLTSSSSLSVSEDIATPVTPDEDSIDAWIGKDIRDLNNLISSASRRKANSAARSPTKDEISNVIRQNTRFGRAASSSLRLSVPRVKPRSKVPESPPPPPPPEDDEEDEEDSFAEEIRKLRESRRLNANAPEQEATKEDEESEASETCVVAALQVRNATNAIHELLLEALKPFEDRQREEEKATALDEEQAGGDAVTAELQAATQTIVSQLDLAFADMTERRKADLKAEADAAAAAKEVERKQKKEAEDKKKTDEKEAKQREMEMLRLIPMQGKLLTCSADIEKVLTQLESVDAGALSAVDAEINALRSHTQRKLHEIEARMSAAASNTGQEDRRDGISWRTVDWVHDNVEIDHVAPSERSDSERRQVPEDVAPGANASAESEEPFKEVLQRQVLEKLDLTMLQLKHVLAFDTKEAADAKEKELQEKEEQDRQQAQQKREDEREELEREDAANARQRVMGLTSVDEVEGWVEEGHHLHGHDSSLKHLMTLLKNCESSQNEQKNFSYLGEVASNQEEVLRQFDRLTSAAAAPALAEDSDEEVVSERNACIRSSARRQKDATRVTTPIHRKPQWIEAASCSSDSEGDASDSDSDDDPPSVWVDQRRPKRHEYRRSQAPLRFPVPRDRVSSSHHRHMDKYSDTRKRRDVRFSSQSKSQRSRRGASQHQEEVDRTIQALQAERRQKATWIRSRLCSPAAGHRPAY
ncbi:hypothetical protein PHYPSEUDO_001180 [Phytophthora pseudosyringae]|uniref:Uncharacterized protein n=1 Tax=Phytophthora pseudosyringae TaxID=221518 RepID=A0A8T1V7A1_9STRA|nr:hypothetical protein PHYPSEUDO_001180 [Phytophthora pseudosyringae]